MLAISLHATNDELRDEAGAAEQEVPDRRADGRHPRLSGPVQRRRVTFEYVMLKGVNDSPAEARPWSSCSRACRPRST
jgi:23S rRNA (adenine2503-C2)-methyltransferase